MKRMFSIFVVLLMAAQLFAQSDMKINIIIGGVTKSAILADTRGIIIRNGKKIIAK